MSKAKNLIRQWKVPIKVRGNSKPYLRNTLHMTLQLCDGQMFWNNYTSHTQGTSWRENWEKWSPRIGFPSPYLELREKPFSSILNRKNDTLYCNPNFSQKLAKLPPISWVLVGDLNLSAGECLKWNVDPGFSVFFGPLKSDSYVKSCVFFRIVPLLNWKSEFGCYI